MNQTAILTGPRKVEFASTPLPDVGPRQVRVRLQGCGICGSNLPVWEGRPWFEYPRAPGTPGHEGWGVIEAVGREINDLAEGGRVALLSQHAFATYDVADARQVVPLPPELDDQPFPGEALGCAMNVFRRCDIHAGQTVAVVGAGFLGLLLIQMAAHVGARVLAISRRASSREAATRMGAAETISLDDHGAVIEQVKDLTHGTGAVRVIEATGFQGPLDLASELTAERGRLIIAGYHQDGPRQVNLQLWNWRGLDVINAHERDATVYVHGTRLAALAVADGWLDPTPLYTHRFPLHRLSDALECARLRPDGFLKAMVVPDHTVHDTTAASSTA